MLMCEHCDVTGMPQTRVVYFLESDGTSPVWEWLVDLRRSHPKAFAKCVVRLRRLIAMGHELRRPEADLLRDGIYELRVRFGTVNYRLLYFFHGQQLAIVAYGLTKEGAVPPTEITRAVPRKQTFERDPVRHTFRGEL